MRRENSSCSTTNGSRKRASAWVSLLAVALAFSSAHGAQFDGYTEPFRTIDLAAAEQGVIGEIRVEEGDSVKKGDVLVRLDVAVLEADLKIAELKAANTGPVDVRKAELELRQSRYDKLAKLEKSGNANTDELERAKSEQVIAAANLGIAQAEHEANRLEVERTKAQIERRTLRSPVDGIVSRIERDAGESVTLAEPDVLTVVQLDRLLANFFVPPAVAAKLEKGRNADVHFTDTDETAIGKIDFIAPIADAASGTVRVKLVIQNPDGKFGSGLRCVLKAGE